VDLLPGAPIHVSDSPVRNSEVSAKPQSDGVPAQDQSRGARGRSSIVSSGEGAENHNRRPSSFQVSSDIGGDRRASLKRSAVAQAGSDHAGSKVGTRYSNMSAAADILKDETVQEQFQQAQIAMARPPRENMTNAELLQFWLMDFVESNTFDYIISAILLLNAVAMGVQVELDATGVNAKTEFDIISILFSVLFTVELILRIASRGLRRFLTSSDRFWNIFDVVVVSMLLVDQMMTVAGSADGREVVGLMNILRIGRAIRLVRVIRLVPALKQTVYLIWASMASFIWTSLLMLIMMYCFAIFFTDQGTQFRKNAGKSNLVNDQVHSDWGSIGSSIQTLFMAMTGGVDWSNIITSLGEESVLNLLIFNCYITFATMVMLNLVTGVFVEGAQRIIREDKDAEVIKTAVSSFHEIDADITGSISIGALSANLQSPAMAAYCNALGINPGEICDLFQVMDTDNSGSLCLVEFVDACIKLRAPARALDLAQLSLRMKALSDQVEDGISTITEELSSISEMLEEGSSDDSKQLPPVLD